MHDNQKRDPQIKYENQLKVSSKISPCFVLTCHPTAAYNSLSSSNSCCIFKLPVSRHVSCSSSQHTLELPNFPFLHFNSCISCIVNHVQPFPLTFLSFCFTLVIILCLTGYKYMILHCFRLSNQNNFPQTFMVPEPPKSQPLNQFPSNFPSNACKGTFEASCDRSPTNV